MSKDEDEEEFEVHEDWSDKEGSYSLVSADNYRFWVPIYLLQASG